MTAAALAAAPAVTWTPELVPATLRDYGAATRRAVARYLATDAPAPYLDDLIADYPGRPGKMMRPSLCIAVARAFGADLDDVVPSAAAIEMFHNALLIHDDIEDGSEVRRGAPTLHRTHGIPLAINAGDALLLLALKPLTDNIRTLGERTGLAILATMQVMARETAEGQALELGWRDHNRIDLTEADYMDMVLKKTAWMSTIWPAQIGVLIGARGRVDPETVVRFGFFLGVAFQIQDDLLNLVADAAYGKERHGDLMEGKRTLMLIHALEHCDAADRTTIRDHLARPRDQRSPATAEAIVAIMERHGSVDHARRLAGALAGAAGHEFERAFGHLPDSSDKAFVAGLIPWVFERT